MKNVLIISYYWPPSGGAGVQRWLKFTKYLPEFGWEPIIITVKPEDATYPSLDPGLEEEVPESLRVIRTSSRNIFRYYKRIFKSQQVPHAGFANVNVASLPQKIARFIRGNFFIPDPRKGWNHYAYLAAKKVLTEEKNIDVIITTSPPHSTQLIGLNLSKEFKIPWMADLRDPWTDIFYYHQLYPTFAAHRLNLRYEKKVLKNADRIITVGPSLRSLFINKYSLPAEKVLVVYNGFDEDDFDHTPAVKDDTFTITYVGTLSDVYPIDSLLDAFLELLKTNPEIKIRFVGEVSVVQRNKLNRIPPENIEFVSYVIHSEAITLMERSHVLLLVIPDHDTSKSILTGKLFEYLAVGCPILGIGPVDGDAANILNECQAGEMVEFTNKVRLKTILTDWAELNRKGELCIHSSGKEKYSRRKLTATLSKQLDELS